MKGLKMKLRVIVKSRENGDNEQTYFCTDETLFDRPATEFFYMGEGDTIDIDKTIDGLDYFDELLSLPLAFDRALKAV